MKSSRRKFLALSAGLAILVSITMKPWKYFSSKKSKLSDEDWILVGMFADVIIPKTIRGPSATQAGIIDFLKNIESKKVPAYAHMKSKMTWTNFYTTLVFRLEEKSQKMFDRSFSTISDVEREKIVQEMASTSAAQVGYKITGLDQKEDYSDQELFSNARIHILQGYFAEPVYGGNKDYSAWNSVGHVCHMNYPNPPESCHKHTM